MKSIELTRGQFTIVDDEDFEVLSKFNWCVSISKCGNKRAVRCISVNGKSKCLLMHRFIMNPPDNMEVDHRNGDSLDNRKNNLRICTPTENRRNLGLRVTNKSGYKGVSWCRVMKKWVATITCNKKKIVLGYSDNKDIANNLYKEGSLKYHGEFSRILSEVN